MDLLSPKGMLSLVSINRVNREPDFTSIGGFVVISGNQDICFDWIEGFGNIDIDKDGYLTIDWILQDFDKDYFRESNEYLTNPDWIEIINSDIEEIHVEIGFVIDGKEEIIPMKVVNFAITLWDFTQRKYVDYPFSAEQIKAYNKKIYKEIGVTNGYNETN